MRTMGRRPITESCTCWSCREHARPQPRPAAAGTEEHKRSQPRCPSGPPATEPSGPGAKLPPPRGTPIPSQLPPGPGPGGQGANGGGGGQLANNPIFHISCSSAAAGLAGLPAAQWQCAVRAVEIERGLGLKEARSPGPGPGSPARCAVAMRYAGASQPQVEQRAVEAGGY
jgi:hypothetical protein